MSYLPFNFRKFMTNKQDIPESIPEWLHEEYVKWKASPKRYETLYSVSANIIKKYLEAGDKNEKSKERSSKQEKAH